MPNIETGIGLFFAGIGIGILLMLAGRGGWRNISFFGLTFNRPRDQTPEEFAAEREDRKLRWTTERRQIEVAFLRYSEAAVGMVPMVEASGPANESLGAWFDLASAAIAAALSITPEDHLRVAIWADLGDPSSFTLLGAVNHNRNDPAIATLSKEGTIAAIAWKSKSGEYLCVDVTKDRKFKSRSGRPKPYTSIFAIRVGEQRQPWGVITIDAPRRDCFEADDLVIVRRYALLVSAGAAIAVAKYAPRPVVTTVATPGPARIVGLVAGGPGTGGEREPTDGES